MAQINPNAELKSQVLNYLKVFKLEVELLINFGSKSFHFKDSFTEMKSVKSINPFKSVIQKSYDIVKSHGGSLKVESKEGEGSEFVIQLPVV